jgi:hypothetical protein
VAHGLVAVILTSCLVISGQSTASLELRCDQAVDALRNREFHLDIGAVRLEDGKACVHATGSDPPCEWEVELTRAERWNGSQRFLLVIVNANHLLGSGAWDYVFLYRCDGHKYVPIFSERYLYGAKVELGKAADLWITAGLWGPNDPTCCASQTRRAHLVWRERQKRFVVTESQLIAMKGRE